MRLACWRWRPPHRGLFGTYESLQRVDYTSKDCFGETPKPARETRALPDPSLRFGEISLFNLEPDKFSHATALRGER